MSYAIKFTSKAKKAYAQNLDYLMHEWGAKVTNEFIDRVDSILESIRKDPFMYSYHNPSKKIRKCVIHSRIILYYRVKGKTIEILRLWNTSQNPDKLGL